MGNPVVKGLGIPDNSVPTRGFGGQLPVTSLPIPDTGITLGGDSFSIIWDRGSWTAAPFSSYTTHTSSGGWALHDSIGSGTFRDLWGDAANDMWATNLGDNLYHWDGTNWTPFVLDQPGTVNTIWGFASDDVWAAGLHTSTGKNTYWHWDGAVWTNDPPSSLKSESIIDMWGSGPNDYMWAISAEGSIFYNTDLGFPGSWETYINFPFSADPGPGMFSIYGSTANDIWIGGELGQTYYWDGAVWTKGSVGGDNTETLYETFGFANNNMWMAGERSGGAVIFHFNGDAWSEKYYNSSIGAVKSSWGAAADDVWFACEDGNMLHWDGASVTVDSTFAGIDFAGMWGFSATNVWAAAGDTAADVYHFAGFNSGGSTSIVGDHLLLNNDTGTGTTRAVLPATYNNFDITVLYQYDNAVEEFFPSNEIVYLSLKAVVDEDNYFTLSHLWNPNVGPELRVSVTTDSITRIIVADSGHASARALRLIRFNGRIQAYAGSLLLADFRGWRTESVTVEVGTESTLSPLPLTTEITSVQPQILVTFGTEITPFVDVIANRIVGSTPAYRLPGVVEVQIHAEGGTTSLGEVFTYYPPLQLTVSGLEGTTIAVNNDRALRDSSPTLPGLRLYD